jgi:hypothetical protein
LYQAKQNLKYDNKSTIILDCFDKNGNQIEGMSKKVYDEIYEGEVRFNFICVPRGTVSFELSVR